MKLTLPWPHRNGHLYRQACACAARQQGIVDIGGAESIDVSIEFVPPSYRWRDVDGAIFSMMAGLDGLADALGVDDRIFRLSPSPRIAEGEIGGFVRVTVSRLVDMLHGDVDLETELPAPQGLQLDAQAK